MRKKLLCFFQIIMWSYELDAIEYLNISFREASVVNHRSLRTSAYKIEKQTFSEEMLRSRMERTMKVSSHKCNREITANLMKYNLLGQYEGNDNILFNARYLLSNLRNKRLGIFGDTVGLQLFHALDADLADYETFSHDGNGTHTSNIYMCSKKQNTCGFIEPLKNRQFSAVRYYSKFNATILFCNYPSFNGDALRQGTYYDFCGKDVIRSDYIIIANGGWYRPLGINIDMYLKSLFRKEKLLAENYFEARKFLAETNPRAVIIWRTIPHVGSLDENTAMGLNNPEVCCSGQLFADCCYPHRDGRLWSNVTNTAEWVLRYNEVIQSIGNYFRDEFIDWFSLSLKFISYFNAVNVPTHADSMHWCDGGLPSAANLLLLESVVHANRYISNNPLLLHHQQLPQENLSLSGYRSGEYFSVDVHPWKNLREDEIPFKQSVTFAMLPNQQLDAVRRSIDKYTIYKGLWPQGVQETHLMRIIYERSAYNCLHDVSTTLIRHHLERSQPTPVSPSGFNAEFFLDMMRDKTITILGDSLGRQLFHSLDHDLMAHETLVVNGNGSRTTNTYLCKKRLNWCGYVEPPRNRYYAASRYYGKFNATLSFCNDPFLQSPRFQRGGIFEFCGQRAIYNSHFILLASGPWYKPRGEEFKEYRRHLFQREIFFSISAQLARRNLAAMNPNVKVMWLNTAHVGRIDEFNAMGMNDPAKCCRNLSIMRKDCCYPYKDGLMWSNIGLCAEWVHRINRIIDAVSAQYKDPLIDWYSLSLQYINYFTPQRIPTHQDSMHWCAGGLNRATNLLIQDAIQSLALN